jgi:hypothetical protein
LAVSGVQYPRTLTRCLFTTEVSAGGGSAGKPNIQYIYSISVVFGLTLNELLEEGNARAEISRAKRKESDLPAGLKDLQGELKLSDDDVEVLAQINFRGKRPKDKEGWRFLIETLNMLGQRKPQK